MTNEDVDNRPQYKNCRICNEPMEEFFYKLRWEFHERCMNCHYCGKQVQLEIVQKRFKNKQLICHQPCEDKFYEQEFKNKPVIVTQAHLDFLNKVNLMFAANLELSPETNQKEAALMASLWAVDMKLDQLFITVKRMEAITASLSIVLSKDKSKAISMIQSTERKKFDDVVEYRKKQLEPKPAIKATAPKEPKPKLSKDEKDHENMVKAYKMLGMSAPDIEIAFAKMRLVKEGPIQ